MANSESINPVAGAAVLANLARIADLANSVNRLFAELINRTDFSQPPDRSSLETTAAIEAAGRDLAALIGFHADSAICALGHGPGAYQRPEHWLLGDMQDQPDGGPHG